MTYSARTVAYFMSWGLIYGLLLGAFSGTAILPYLGTIYSVIWGTGVGLACGFLSGVVSAVVHRTSFHVDTDLDRFRRRLSLGIGALIAVAAPVILFASSQGVLWYSSLMRDMQPWTALSLFSASFWGLLSSAYIASHYPSFIANLTARREYQDVLMPQENNEVLQAMQQLAKTGFTRWICVLGTAGGALIYTVNTSRALGRFSPIGPIEILGYLAVGAVGGLIATAVVSLYLVFGNAALLTFLKRIIFREYFPHLPMTWHRWSLTLTAFIFTTAVTYWTFFFAPVIGVLAAMIVYRTVALPDETIDKAKRKEKNALALEDAMDDDMPLLDEGTIARLQEQKS